MIIIHIIYQTIKYVQILIPQPYRQSNYTLLVSSIRTIWNYILYVSPTPYKDDITHDQEEYDLIYVYIITLSNTIFKSTQYIDKINMYIHIYIYVYIWYFVIVLLDIWFWLFIYLINNFLHIRLSSSVMTSMYMYTYYNNIQRLHTKYILPKYI